MLAFQVAFNETHAGSRLKARGVPDTRTRVALLDPTVSPHLVRLFVKSYNASPGRILTLPDDPPADLLAKAYDSLDLTRKDIVVSRLYHLLSAFERHGIPPSQAQGYAIGVKAGRGLLTPPETAAAVARLSPSQKVGYLTAVAVHRGSANPPSNAHRGTFGTTRNRFSRHLPVSNAVPVPNSSAADLAFASTVSSALSSVQANPTASSALATNLATVQAATAAPTLAEAEAEIKAAFSTIEGFVSKAWAWVASHVSRKAAA